MKGLLRLLISVFGPPGLYLIAYAVGVMSHPELMNDWPSRYMLAPLVGVLISITVLIPSCVILSGVGLAAGKMIGWVLDGFIEDRKSKLEKVKRAQLAERQGGSVSVLDHEHGELSLRK